MTIQFQNCEKCLLQAAWERYFNILGYIPCQYDTLYLNEEPFSPATQEIEFLDMVEEEEEDHEEEDPEEEEEH